MSWQASSYEIHAIACIDNQWGMSLAQGKWPWSHQYFYRFVLHISQKGTLLSDEASYFWYHEKIQHPRHFVLPQYFLLYEKAEEIDAYLKELGPPPYFLVQSSAFLALLLDRQMLHWLYWVVLESSFPCVEFFPADRTSAVRLQTHNLQTPLTFPQFWDQRKSKENRQHLVRKLVGNKSIWVRFFRTFLLYRSEKLEEENSSENFYAGHE